MILVNTVFNFAIPDEAASELVKVAAFRKDNIAIF